MGSSVRCRRGSPVLVATTLMSRSAMISATGVPAVEPFLECAVEAFDFAASRGVVRAGLQPGRRLRTG